MKGTDNFKATIKAYLDERAKFDSLFRQRYESTARTIDDVVTYILNYVQKSGCNGFCDDEIYGLAVHVIDEPELEIGKPINAHIVVNHQIELTEEEKAEQRKEALQRYRQEEYDRISQRNQPKGKVKKIMSTTPSLFDL